MTRYPLTWPSGWRRTPASQRTSGRFSVHGTGTYTYKQQVTVGEGVKRILKSLGMLGVRDGDAIISTNVEVRLDGLPRSGQAAPQDPGAAVYWKKSGYKAQKVIAIDHYDRVADNLAAIAATLEAMRAIDRHGGATILDRAFTGFDMLPAPKDWREVLGLNGEAGLDVAQAQYRKLALKAHPDQGGSQAAMAKLNSAWAKAQEELR